MMVKQTYKLPDTFHVAAVQVATVWTNPESARDLDELATANPTNIEKWLMDLSKEEKLALCDDNRVQTQLLYGEAAVVTEVDGDWAKIYIPSQPSRKNELGYPGWVPRKQLKAVHREEWQRPDMAAIIDKYTWLENEAGENVIKLSYMTFLPVEQVNDSRVEVLTPHGKGFLPKEAVVIFPTEKGGELGDGESIVQAGKRFIGLEYLWGGMSAFGYDCSGFAYGMHKANGYPISRDASDQAAYGKEIPLDEIMPGDLLFFAYEDGKGKIHHVGIYSGEGKMIHAPSTGRGIEIVSIAGTKYERELCIARRYWEAGDV